MLYKSLFSSYCIIIDRIKQLSAKFKCSEGIYFISYESKAIINRHCRTLRKQSEAIPIGMASINLRSE